MGTSDKKISKHNAPTSILDMTSNDVFYQFP